MAEEFFDLIYGPKEVEVLVLKRYPHAKLVDASDSIHTERFECAIEGVGRDEFYPFAIREGFATYCLGFNLLLEVLRFPEPKNRPGYHKEVAAELEGWLDKAKEEEVNARKVQDVSTLRCD